MQSEEPIGEVQSIGEVQIEDTFPNTFGIRRWKQQTIQGGSNLALNTMLNMLGS
jgi:hypothetical protein